MDIFSIFVNMRYIVCFHWNRGDSNEYTQYTIFQYKKKRNSPLIILNLQLWDFTKGLKNEFEPLKVYSMSVGGEQIIYFTHRTGN